VHGYAVDQPNATGSFFPAYFKRMYWAGVPVLPAQKGSPQTVGIDWQGNGSAVNWPTDEFSALETGVPLAKFFGQQAALGRTMKVIAHSLGNMVVNSAISRLIVSGTGTQALGAITSFVMNEPAVPTEAFDAVLDPTDLSTLLVAHATDLDGFPFDQEWQTEWQNMQTPLFSANLTQWNDTLHSPTYITRPLPQYPLRWRQERPANGAPDKDSGTIPQRGPWVGLFASNPKHVNMTNTFSSNDTVLSVIWFAGELAEKPDILVGPDNMVSQYWAALTNTDGNQEKLWGDPACTVASACLHANIVRQWAELAYWFPSLSDAAGTHAINPVTSIDFTPYDPSLAKPATTHSYLKISPYSDVYPAWQLVKAALK